MLYVNKRRASAILLALLVAFGGVEAQASSTDVFKDGVVEEEAILRREILLNTFGILLRRQVHDDPAVVQDFPI